MSHAESQAWCHRLLKRLPELQWRLPYWPKGYMELIPPGLFYITADWTPTIAIAEVKRHINRLLDLDLSTSQAFYLSQKIETQIHVLVLVGQKMGDVDRNVTQTTALTRAQYIQQLKTQERHLREQYQALEQSYKESNYTLALEQELKKMTQHLDELGKKIALA